MDNYCDVPDLFLYGNFLIFFCTFLLGQKGTQKGHPPLKTPKRREKP
jgi:hypothetical protein